MHKLLAKQLRSVTDEGGRIDAEKFVALVARTYDEFDLERRMNDRASKLMEEELMAANEVIRERGEARLTGALESAPCAIALVDDFWIIQNVNSAMALLCGQARDTLLGRSCSTVLSEANSEIPAGMFENLQSGQTIEFEVSGRWFLGEARALGDGTWAIAFSEVTALKERETALILARNTAESASRLKSDFLATMSHELRTPLNAILGFSEVLRDMLFGRDEKALDRYSEYAASIHSSGKHLLDLISDVLDISKIDAGAYAINPQLLDFGVVVETVASLVAPQAARGRVNILPFRSVGNRMLEADARALKQILLNILSNAVKFTPEGGEVEVLAKPDDGAVLVTVRDTGIGIAPEHLGHVFEAFHQGNARVSRRYEGTGLGLSITKRLVELHGGTISIDSEQGVGTRVSVRLPRKVPVDQRSAVAA